MDSILIDKDVIEKYNEFNSINLYDLAFHYYSIKSYPSCEFLLNIILNSTDQTNYVDAIKLLIIGKDSDNLKCYSDAEYVKVITEGMQKGIKECGLALGKAYQQGLLGLPKDPDKACECFLAVIKSHSNKTYTGLEEFKDFGFAYSQISQLSKKISNETLEHIKPYVEVE